MKVSEILRSKGYGVQTVAADASVRLAVHQLASRGVGALVVVDAHPGAVGLLWERDVVRALARHGAAVETKRVSDVMRRDVAVCTEDTTIADAMQTMTNRRQPQLPVVRDGEVVGIITLGDVVRLRMDELGLEAAVLRELYQSSR